MQKFVDGLSDDKLQELMGVIHNRIYIPNWFFKYHFEENEGVKISQEDWLEFLDYAEGFQDDYSNQAWEDYDAFLEDKE